MKRNNNHISYFVIMQDMYKMFLNMNQPSSVKGSEILHGFKTFMIKHSLAELPAAFCVTIAIIVYPEKKKHKKENLFNKTLPYFM